MCFFKGKAAIERDLNNLKGSFAPLLAITFKLIRTLSSTMLLRKH